MLNLAFMFDDAVHALTHYAKDLAVVPLPAAVYMMQVEIGELRSRNHAFAEVCDAFYQSRRVAQPFENLNESYWI